jgi:hypothetical protein
LRRLTLSVEQTHPFNAWRFGARHFIFWNFMNQNQNYALAAQFSSIVVAFLKHTIPGVGQGKVISVKLLAELLCLQNAIACATSVELTADSSLYEVVSNFEHAPVWLSYINRDGNPYWSKKLCKERSKAAMRVTPARIVIGLDGGLITGVTSDVPLEYLVYDYDIEGSDDVATRPALQDCKDTVEVYNAGFYGSELSPAGVSAAFRAASS